ncbi:hypothetical protein [uncultured Mailhella sp.]|uniref:hypothetical protein n=1 Tax=uncultured Mailhella sp. TaxID=1981031 RepID=UPI0032091FB8
MNESRCRSVRREEEGKEIVIAGKTPEKDNARGKKGGNRRQMRPAATKMTKNRPVLSRHRQGKTQLTRQLAVLQRGRWKHDDADQ